MGLKEGGIVISDPSYFKDEEKKVKVVGRVARWHFLCKMADVSDVFKSKSNAQIIVPTKEQEKTREGKKSDIYISMQSASTMNAPEGMCVISISAKVYSNSNKASDFKKELECARAILFGAKNVAL